MTDKDEGIVRVALTTLGCKVNQYESASFLTELEGRGCRVVPFAQPADIYIVNTCAVTAKAAAQCRQQLRRAVRNNPEARLVVTGCYAQVGAQEILELVDRPICIVGNGFKHMVVDVALSGKHCDLEMFMGDIGRQREISRLPVPMPGGRTRAFLKVQDGCDRFCSYCIVPFARGRSRSLPPDEVARQADILTGQGYKEMVLTGIHLGLYGKDLRPAASLSGLLALLEEKRRHVRYRLSSLEPAEISVELLNLLAGSENFMPHLHIPLQSGDDKILSRMNRRYTVEHFARVVEKCLEFLPTAAIGADVLTGFPGEDEDAFQHTVNLIDRLPLAYLHVFPYSKRPGTVAARMSDQVGNQVKKERVALLRELDHKKRTVFYRQNIGMKRRVLVEGGSRKTKLMKGFTENYIPVYIAAPKTAVNQIVEVRIDRLLDGGGVLGIPV